MGTPTHSIPRIERKKSVMAPLLSKGNPTVHFMISTLSHSTLLNGRGRVPGKHPHTYLPTNPACCMYLSLRLVLLCLCLHTVPHNHKVMKVDNQPGGMTKARRGGEIGRSHSNLLLLPLA